MKIFVYSKFYEKFDFLGHIFPAVKFRMVKERLEREGILTDEEYVEPQEPSYEDLLIVHEKEYLDDLYALRWSRRTISSELPLTKEIVKGFFIMADGTYRASLLALENGGAYHIGGGFHHAYPDHAEGFCYINDIAYAVMRLKKEKKIKKAAIVDCDVHQGNGTAYIFRGDHDVFTFSIHQEFIYPVPKERSSWDIGLQDGIGDDEYLAILEEAVCKIYEEHKPEIVIYQAGADPYVGDQLGGLALSIDGLKRRDITVILEARKRGIPIAVTLGGGYANEIGDVVEIHTNTAKVLLRAIEG